ncbi:MAG: SRPBCC domain-containing protein [Candidatus Dormiibacterota bacterium]
MAGPLMHMVLIDADAEKIYTAISTGKGLASFWTRDSQAEPKAGSTAKFGFGGPKLEVRVAELTPGKLVKWSNASGFPGWETTTVTWEIKPAEHGGNDVWFTHEGWPADLPASELASVNYTWGRIVGRLKKHVETGEAVPFFP